MTDPIAARMLALEVVAQVQAAALQQLLRELPAPATRRCAQAVRQRAADLLEVAEPQAEADEALAAELARLLGALATC